MSLAACRLCVVAQSNKTEKQKLGRPVKALIQHHFHHFLLVKANYKVQLEGKQILPLDGRTVHTSMGGIDCWWSYLKANYHTYLHISTYTIQCPGSDMAVYPVSWFTFLNTFQITSFSHNLVPETQSYC